MEKIGFDSGFGVFYTYNCDEFGCVISIAKLRRDYFLPLGKSKWKFVKKIFSSMKVMELENKHPLQPELFKNTVKVEEY